MLLLPVAQIWWQTGSKSSTTLMKIQALLANGKYWQNDVQSKNSKKWNKFYIVLKWQRLAKIGKMWDKQTGAKSGINFTLAFNGKYCHKKSDKMRVRKPYGKKWQNYGKEWYKLL